MTTPSRSALSLLSVLRSPAKTPEFEAESSIESWQDHDIVLLIDDDADQPYFNFEKNESANTAENTDFVVKKTVSAFTWPYQWL